MDAAEAADTTNRAMNSLNISVIFRVVNLKENIVLIKYFLTGFMK